MMHIHACALARFAPLEDAGCWDVLSACGTGREGVLGYRYCKAVLHVSGGFAVPRRVASAVFHLDRSTTAVLRRM